jgi:exodeoxyribonuclease-1
VVVPLNTLTPEAAQRWAIDERQAERNRQRLLAAEGFKERLLRIHRMREFEAPSDPDQALYTGGFFTQNDRRRMDSILQSKPDELAEFPPVFDDPRLPEMLFRYRARNWPETLSTAEQERWEEYRQTRLFEPDGGGSLQMHDYLAILDQLEWDATLPEEKRRLIPDLLAWAELIG